VNNFSRVNFLSKLNSSPLIHDLDMAHLYSSNGTEGLIQNVSSLWKVKDHGYCDVTWKPNTIFNFEYKTRCMRVVMVQPMYMHVV
jgi:hypothetical protein